MADEKLNESEEAGMKKVSDWLEELRVEEEESKHILHIIANMSYKGGHGGTVESLEGKLFKMRSFRCSWRNRNCSYICIWRDEREINVRSNYSAA